MKRIIYLLLFFSLPLNATDWYFDSQAGNDSWNGHTVNTPKKSMSELRNVLYQLATGDAVYLKRGSVWNSDNIRLMQDGALLNPIRIMAYGTGANPKFTGYIDYSDGWSKAGNVWTKSIPFTYTNYNKRIEVEDENDYYNIWNYLNFILINGVPHAIGRYPNSGYLDFEDVSADLRSTATDNNASWINNIWSGGQIGFCPAIDGTPNDTRAPWILERVGISGNSPNTLSLNVGDFATFNGHVLMDQDQWGNKTKYFISNDPDCNDQNGEWSFNHTTKIMSIFHSSDLNSFEVKLPYSNYLMEFDNCSYIYISNIDFEGSLIHTIKIHESNGIKIENCNFKYTPYSAIWIYGSNGTQILNNTIDYACSNGIFEGESSNTTISGNILTNIGLWETMGGDRDGENYQGIHSGNREGDLSITENYIENVGYSAIGGNGYYSPLHNLYINDNIIYNFCDLLTDGAGIYWYIDSVPGGIKEIKRNIIISYAGNPDFQYYNNTQHNGIYLDGHNYGFDIQDNTIYGSGAGYFDHGTESTVFRGNNIYNAGVAEGTLWPSSWIGVSPTFGHDGSGTDNLDMKLNTFVSGSTSRYVALWQFNSPFNSQNCDIDSNWYYTPFMNPASMFPFTTMNATTWVMNPVTFTQWKETTSFDDHSTLNENSVNYYPNSATEYNYVKLLSNLSMDSTRTINLYDIQFLDKDGNSVEDSIVLEPKESMFLFRYNLSGTTSNMALIEPIGWGTGILSLPEESDTLVFEEYTSANNVNVIYSADCADSVVIRSVTGGAGTIIDTVGMVNFNHGGETAPGWISLPYYPAIDSVELNDGSWFITTVNLEGTGAGVDPGYFDIFNVDYYSHYLPNADNNPRVYYIHGADPQYDYEVQFYSSKAGSGAQQTSMTIGGETVYISHYGNSTTIASIDTITPAGDSSVTISFDRTDASYGYINAVIIIKSQATAGDYTPSWVRFNNVNFGSGLDSIRYAVDFNQGTGQKSFELRLDGTGGTLIDSFNVSGTGCGIRGELLPSAITGIHHLYALLDTLDTYSWMKFYATSTSVTYQNITDTFYMRQADLMAGSTKGYSASCGDTTVMVMDDVTFLNVNYNNPVNRVKIKMNYSADPYENVLYFANEEGVFGAFDPTDTVTDCSITAYSIPILETGDINYLTIFGDQDNAPEVQWIYFYYIPEQEWSIFDDTTKYKITNFKIR